MLLYPFSCMSRTCVYLWSSFGFYLPSYYQVSSFTGSLFSPVIELLSEYMLDLVQGLLKVLSFQAEAELQELYFEPLVKKEQLEEKMRNIKEVKCRVVTCKTVSAGRLFWLWALFCAVVTQQNMENIWDEGPYLVTKVLLRSFIYAGNETAYDSPGSGFMLTVQLAVMGRTFVMRFSSHLNSASRCASNISSLLLIGPKLFLHLSQVSSTPSVHSSWDLGWMTWSGISWYNQLLLSLSTQGLTY